MSYKEDHMSKLEEYLDKKQEENKNNTPQPNATVQKPKKEKPKKDKESIEELKRKKEERRKQLVSVLILQSIQSNNTF
jgi:outer membrane biosynthesis protein TonB